MTKSKLVIFWDYDTQWGADRSRAPGGPKNWGKFEFENTERLLELHEMYEIKACFAVVGAAALFGERPYHDPDQIRRIHASGHEVASHSFHHDWLPGLTQQDLYNTLRISKDVLEQCIGGPVTTFVPPYNQPFIYPKKFAPALSECREGGKNHITLPMLCAALSDIGFEFARVSYYPLPQYLLKTLFRYQIMRLSLIERISGLNCVRLNTPVGFASPTLAILEQCAARQQGIVVVYAHPHSLHFGSPQDERYLIPFFERVNELRRQGKIRITSPSDLLKEDQL